LALPAGRAHRHDLLVTDQELIVFSLAHPRRTRTTRRSVPAIAGALLAVAAAATPAQAALTLAGPLDPATSAPAFYQDASGLKLGLCHPGTVNCGPAVPGEDFYNMVTSTLALPNGGTALLTLNVTLAPNVTGNPSAFNRVRIQIDGAPAGTYSITHPYGTDTVDVPAAGARGRTTTDIGCLVAASGPCAFTSALAGRYGPFITAAPGAPAPPAGFIGDAVTAVPVTGSPLGTNFFRVQGPGIPVGGVQTNTMALMGKLFGGAVPAFANSGDLAFGDQLVSTTSAVKTVTVTSNGVPGAGSNLTIGAVALAGADKADYAIVSDTCAGKTLPSGSTCSVGVTATPQAAGARSATLTFADNTAAATHTVALAGRGTVPVVVPAPAAPAPLVVQAPIAQPLTASALRVPSRLRVRVARHAGIGASFTAPAGVSVARVRLLKVGASRPIATKLVVLESSGRQTVHLRAPKAHSGRYVLEVAVGPSASALTQAVIARLTLTR
jgi:hypothetical protein